MEALGIPEAFLNLVSANRLSAFCALLCVTAASLAWNTYAVAQGAWVQPRGQAYLKFSYGASTAADQYRFDGERKPYADNVDDYAFFDRSAYFYLESGVADHGTMILSIPYKRIVVRDAAFRYRTYGFGSAIVGARFDLGPAMQLGAFDALALGVTAGIPLGYTRNFAPSTGAGQVDGMAVLSYGRSFYPAPIYLQFGFGYRYRSSLYVLSRSVDCREGVDVFCVDDKKPDYSDELVASVESGVSIGRVFLQGLANLVWSTKAPLTGFTVSNPVPTEQRYLKLGGGAAFLLGAGASVSVQAFATPYGQNTVRSIDIYLGFDYRLSYGKKQ